jgi:hypothetical protein
MLLYFWWISESPDYGRVNVQTTEQSICFSCSSSHYLTDTNPTAQEPAFLDSVFQNNNE